MQRVAHITTVHVRTDTRIAVKEVATLAAAMDAEVALFVQDGLGDKPAEAPRKSGLIDTGPKPHGRLLRATQGAWRMYRAVKRWKPDVVHFHDPELIVIGLLLRLSGIQVVYDVHEDVPRQILVKHYLSRPMAKVFSQAAAIAEAVGAWAFNGIVAATPVIAARFPQSKTITVRNFPKLSEFPAPSNEPHAERPPHAGYVGGITEIRGGTTMVEAMAACKTPGAKLRLAGAFAPESYGEELKALPGWTGVDFEGWASRDDVVALLRSVRAGLVVLQPTENYVESLPVKMFEYMAAGLPVIASDFPLWRDIVEEAGCGILVDPLNPNAVAAAIDVILADPEAAQAMGQRGREAVITRYNWETEALRMLTLYETRLGVAQTPRAVAA